MKLRLLLICPLLVAMFSSPNYAQSCRCITCETPTNQRGPNWARYWDNVSRRVRANAPPQLGPGNQGTSQVVFLDFDSGDDGTLDYTQARRDEIVAELELIYQDFDISFTQTLPAGEFSMLVFNEGGFGGGQAEDVDFRNLNTSDDAVLNLDGIGLTDEQIVPASANIAAHELGHLIGLRHAEIFGPIGNGVLAGFGPFYTPDYLGPQSAFESFDHIMATGAFGAPLSTFLTPSWLSERSGVKIRFAEVGVPVDDTENNDSIASAQPLSLQTLIIPNTIIDGENAGVGDFSVSAAVVVGTLDGVMDGQDVFEIDGSTDDLLNIEVLSNVPDRLAVDPIDPNISVFDALGNFVDYYGTDAFNESELETADSVMVDFLLPNDGSFFIEVDSSIVTDSGNYELFVYRFNGVLGDVNCDGVVSLLDVAPFVDLISNSEFNPKADINADNVVDLLDVAPFVALLSGE